MAKKITAIATQKKAGRFNIYLDGKYAFSVSEDVLIKYRLGAFVKDQTRKSSSSSTSR